jgi:serine/threonine-protein kinase
VPGLAGKTIEEATALLTEQGLLLVALEPEFSDSVGAGLIARQDPAANGAVARGATISVAVSKGQDLVAVTPLANLTQQQASDALAAAGLALGTVTGNPDGVLVGAQYQGAELAIGQLLPRGAAIDITLF